MFSEQRTCPKCKRCDFEMVEILRVEPVGHEPGMLVYECSKCKAEATVFLTREQPPNP
jgi:hypothetical protein